MSEKFDTRANAVYNKMMEHDHFSKWMGIELQEISEGYCRLKMTVQEDMLNGFGILHGGVTFSFADSAFAFASNSYGRLSVSLNASMTYSKSAKRADILIAEAKKITLGSRTATFDVEVTNESSAELIALFRGTVFRTEQQHLDT
ncbi:MAG: hydroxyphenylacetyl-CoA thioesterase PaaI [Cyclobacteriaceae bacterium]